MGGNSQLWVSPPLLWAVTGGRTQGQQRCHLRAPAGLPPWLSHLLSPQLNHSRSPSYLQRPRNIRLCPQGSLMSSCCGCQAGYSGSQGLSHTAGTPTAPGLQSQKGGEQALISCPAASFPMALPVQRPLWTHTYCLLSPSLCRNSSRSGIFIY